MLSRPTWLAAAALLFAACKPSLPAAQAPVLPPRRAEIVPVEPGNLLLATAERGWVALEGGRAAVLHFDPAVVRTRFATAAGPVAATLHARVGRGDGGLDLLVAGAPATAAGDGGPAAAAFAIAADAVGASADDLVVRAELAARPPGAATAQLAVAIIAALLGDAPAGDAIVVGGLAADGTLAPAVDARGMAVAAAQAGAERIGVSSVQFDAHEAAALGRDTGAAVVLLDDLDAAYELVTGAALPTPAAAAIPGVPPQVDERAAQALATWRRELAQDWARVIATAEGAGVPAAARDAGAAALASAGMAETARQRGAILAALWLTARARVQAGVALAAAERAPAPAAPALAAASTPAAGDVIDPLAQATEAWWSAVAPESVPDAADQRAAAHAIDEAVPAASAASRQRQLALTRHRALATISAAATATGAEPGAPAIWLALGNELAAYDQRAALHAFRRASLEARLAISSARRRVVPTAAPPPGGPPSPSAPPASR